MEQDYTVPDGTFLTAGSKTFMMDEGELVEIVCSYPDMETAIKGLHEGLGE